MLIDKIGYEAQKVLPRVLIGDPTAIAELAFLGIAAIIVCVKNK